MKVTPSVGKATTASLCVAGLVALALWAKKHRKQEETGHDVPDDLRPVQLSQQDQSFISELARRLAMAEPGTDLVTDPEAQRIAALIEAYQDELRALGIEPVGNLSLRLTATLGGARRLDQEGLRQLGEILLKLQEIGTEPPQTTTESRPRYRLRRRPR